MTTAVTAESIAEFRTLLPGYASRQLHDTQRLAALIGRATARGWGVAQLARECGRDLAGVHKPAGVVMFRLEQAADRDPPTKTGAGRRAPLCGRCEDGWLVDPATRLPIGRCDCRKATA